jgi:GNAT superfamily N-acetyltransferase
MLMGSAIKCRLLKPEKSKMKLKQKAEKILSIYSIMTYWCRHCCAILLLRDPESGRQNNMPETLGFERRMIFRDANITGYIIRSRRNIVEIEIRALSPELLDDYLYFFNSIAFAGHDEYPKCYCVHFHWNEKFEAEFKRGKKCGADWAIDFVRNGIIRGYLAYVDGNVAGWCNANDKTGYAVLVERKELWDNLEQEQKVKAVVCFLVAPNLRDKGVATQLLKRVCEDAAAEGYIYVEGYPLKGEADSYAHHHGPLSLYDKCGFSPYKELKHDLIVRKYL